MASYKRNGQRVMVVDCRKTAKPGGAFGGRATQASIEHLRALVKEHGLPDYRQRWWMLLKG